MKKYKVSKYNLSCVDSEGNLLLYNFLSGPTSISIVKNKDRMRFEEIFTEKKIIVSDKKREKICQQLYQAGIILDIEEDEDALYDAKFYDTTLSKSWELIIMPTQQCNFRCKYCYEDTEFMSKGEMSEASETSILKYVQKNAIYHSKLRVSWFGGEPLLALNSIKRLSEGIIKICAAKKVIYESEMTTNGYNLTPEVFDMLYKNKIYIYQITLDGTRKEHDCQRIKMDGSGTFDKIFENLLYIKNNKDKYKMARITIRTNVTQNIVSNIEAFIQLYQSNFASDRRFILRFTEASKYDNNEDEKYSSRLDDSEYLDRNEFLNFIYNEKYIKKLVPIENVLDMFTPTRYICYAASKNKFVIDPKLNVYKCTVHFDLKENNVGYINSKGDMVLDDKINRMWYVRKAFPKECRECFYLPCCNKTGCPIKYNSRDKHYRKCHMKDLKEIMSINLRRLAKYIPCNIIEMEN